MKPSILFFIIIIVLITGCATPKTQKERKTTVPVKEITLTLQTEEEAAFPALPKSQQQPAQSKQGILEATIRPQADIVLSSLDNETTIEFLDKKILYQNLPAGDYFLEIFRQGFKTKKIPVSIESGKVTNVGEIRLQTGLGNLVLSSPLIGVEAEIISSAGKFLKKAIIPFSAVLPAGSYRIKLTHPTDSCYGISEREITIMEDETTTISNCVPSEEGIRLSIDSDPSTANVILNGAMIGKTPLKVCGIKPGRYSIRIEDTNHLLVSELNLENGNNHHVVKLTLPQKLHPDLARFVKVPAGIFQMGSEQGEFEEQPVHPIYISEYWIGRFEVTVQEYRQCVEENGCKKIEEKKEPYCNWHKAEFDAHPINCVSWYEAQEYAKWYSRKTGMRFRLPTEAEWEKAAKGLSHRKYPWGNDWQGERANYCDRECPFDEWQITAETDGHKTTAPAGSFSAGCSPYGAINMAGNVREWTLDSYEGAYYKHSTRKNPVNKLDTDEKVIRGGSWDMFPERMTTTIRNKLQASERKNYVGFRIVFSTEENAIRITKLSQL